ncbi:MAG: hypothetical protein ABJN96_10170 [Marinomonas sp.]
MNNIDEFNLVTGEIFGECYRSFPVPVRIEKRAIGQKLKDSLNIAHDPNRINLDDREYKLIEHSLSWLIQAGYIWTEGNVSKVTSLDIRLSPLGLETLNQIPESLDESLGSKLAKGSKEVGREVFLNTVSTVLTFGLTTLGA